MNNASRIAFASCVLALSVPPAQAFCHVLRSHNGAVGSIQVRGDQGYSSHGFLSSGSMILKDS